MNGDDISALQDSDALGPEERAVFGVVPAAKQLIVEDIEALDPLLGKAEGISVIGGMLILAPDNDYNVDETTTDFSYEPALLGFQDPPNLPRIVTTPKPGLRGGSD